jgi:membrane-bound lytic murein transglycosylase F
MLPPFPYERVMQRGVIDACAYNNSTDYHVHGGSPRGFHHELLKEFAGHLGVKARVVELHARFDEALEGVNEDHYDLVAMSACASERRRGEVLFSDPLFHSRWVIVQDRERPRVDSLHRLEGREVCCQPGSEGRRVLERLRDSLGVSFKITEVEGSTYEEILGMVERGEVAMAIASEHAALVAARRASRLDCSLALPGSFPVAWAVSREAIFLHAEINHWLDDLKKSGKLAVIYNRYFNNPSPVAARRGTISVYDPLVKEHARLVEWDWRLLAALIYKESRFDPDAISRFGAVGLMQVMPRTAIDLGCLDYLSPRDNIRAGVTYLRSLQTLFARYPIEPEERTKFILAAYNAGPGHVFDAMRLAEERDKDPYTWDGNVDYFLLNKSRPEFYRHALATHGYCDGKQVYDFVNEIIETYAHYKNIILE